MAGASCSCLAGSQNVLGSLAFGCALCGEVFLICLHCHSPALWGIVAFSWCLGRKPPEPEGVAVLDDKGHEWVEITLFIEEELNTITLPSEHTSPKVGTQVGRDLTE